MEQKSTTFMTYGTTLGMIIAFIISLIIFLFFRQFVNYIPFIFLGLAFAFRIAGYGLDRFIDNHK